MKYSTLLSTLLVGVLTFEMPSGFNAPHVALPRSKKMKTRTSSCVYMKKPKQLNSPNEPPSSSFMAASRREAMTAGLTSIAPVFLMAALQPKGSGAKDGQISDNCMNECIYECTKPNKGGRQKSRVECLVLCKGQCLGARNEVVGGIPDAETQKELFPAKP